MRLTWSHRTCARSPTPCSLIGFLIKIGRFAPFTLSTCDKCGRVHRYRQECSALFNILTLPWKDAQTSQIIFKTPGRDLHATMRQDACVTDSYSPAGTDWCFGAGLGGERQEPSVHSSEFCPDIQRSAHRHNLFSTQLSTHSCRKSWLFVFQC